MAQRQLGLTARLAAHTVRPSGECVRAKWHDAGVLPAGPAAIAATVALLAGPSHHARLAPSGFAPFKVKGTGFHARERVRVTITPSTADRVTRRVRATRKGTFAVSFPGVEACAGVSGAAAGSRGSRASFQFSALVCP